MKNLNLTSKSRISIVGLGGIGLSFCGAFTHKGFQVIGVDIDRNKIELLNNSSCPVFEPGLKNLIREAVDRKLLYCTDDYHHAIQNSDITFVTVNTPPTRHGALDLRYVKAVSKAIGSALRKKHSYHLVAIKSTVTPMTTDRVVRPTIERYSGKKCGPDFGLCVNHEFLARGTALKCILHPDMIVIGAYDGRAGDLLEKFHHEFHGASDLPLVRTNIITSELIKFSCNAFLATKISFINMIANVCERLPGVDAVIVSKAMGLDRRINPLFLNPGLSYGGECFPKDVKAFINLSKRLGYCASILEATDRINESQSLVVVKLAKEALGTFAGKTIALLGLAYKTGIADMRESPSIKIVQALLSEGANVKVYDPKAMQNARRIFRQDVFYADSVKECLLGADCCIVVTGWEEFRKLRPADFINVMRRPLLIDGRRIFSASDFIGRMEYLAVGLGRKDRTIAVAANEVDSKTLVSPFILDSST